jgi:hypothetical protein
MVLTLCIAVTGVRFTAACVFGYLVIRALASTVTVTWVYSP